MCVISALLLMFNSRVVFAGISDSVARISCENLDIPILYITTQDSVMPTFEITFPPDGSIGVGITNLDTLPARMWIVQTGDTLYDSGEYVKDTSGLRIRVRGNTTAIEGGDKNPYKLKLQRKADLMFRGNDEVYADKDWILIKDIYNTMAGNMANRAFNMLWSPACQPVFLFMNGNFRGLYLLMENVKRNKRCRVDVSKEGFIFEFDPYYWNEDYYIESRFEICNYTLKYPESEDILIEQDIYLSNCLTQLEDAYSDPNKLVSMVDIPSYARFLWLHDVLGTSDVGGSNMFFCKHDTTANSKVQMICGWDFDSCFSLSLLTKWSRLHSFWWYEEFFNLPQIPFVRTYIDMYDTLVNSSIDIVVAQIDSLRDSPYIQQLDSAQKLDNMRWDTKLSANSRMRYIADYLRVKKTHIAKLMDELKEEYSLWLETNDDYRKADKQIVAIYDIMGRRINPTDIRGWVIIVYDDGSVSKSYRKIW